MPQLPEMTLALGLSRTALSIVRGSAANDIVIWRCVIGWRTATTRPPIKKRAAQVARADRWPGHVIVIQDVTTAICRTCNKCQQLQTANR